MSIEQNRKIWNEYDWKELGEEWSSTTTSEKIFYDRLVPWIFDDNNKFHYDTILEIAPGHGRITKYLINHCRLLYGIDLAKKCVDYCKNRFKQHTFFENDGKTFVNIPDNSIDFIFTYDSLVHAGDDALEGYVSECKRVLKKYGIAFFHYSNNMNILAKKHWRNKTMSNNRFLNYCKDNNLRILKNEIIEWGGIDNLDCFTLFIKE